MGTVGYKVNAEPPAAARVVSRFELSSRPVWPTPAMNSPQEPTLDSLDPLPGRVIAGNFRVDKLIGSGAMGNVYKAEQLSLGKAVAIKVLHPHLMSDETLVARFQREAKNASMLNHANSIQIIDSGQDRDGTLYIAMELLTGRDLAEVIRDDFPLPLPRIVRIMSQVLSALDEAHAQGVVHRDLKPSNIMLIERRGEHDFVKVCDFGIAKAHGLDGKDDRAAMLTIQGLVCGTPEYMSPEQARAEPLDGRADLYSAAVILYQLCTGDIPFRAESPMGIVSRHLAEAPVVPSHRRPDLPIPRALDNLVMRGLEKDRELRFPSAIAFRDELETLAPNAVRPATPVPGQSAMPTQRMVGGRTGVMPGSPATARYGSTADLTPRRSGKGKMVAGLVLLLAGGGALAGMRLMQPSAKVKTAAAGAASAELPAPAVAPPAPASAPALAPEPIAAVPSPSSATPPAAEPAAVEPAATAAAAPLPAPAAPPASRASEPAARRKKAAAPTGLSKPAHDPTADEAQSPGGIAAPAGATKAAIAPPAVEKMQPPGPRELLAEGERLLGQGEVREACARGEEAKRGNPKLPAIYKFLGKCYMRAGNTVPGKENYGKYLELAPTASDAMFIKNIIK